MHNPKISILLATYNPNLEWLGVFLKSINEQDYENYDLYVLDDCSTTISLAELSEFIKGKINKCDVYIQQNKMNLGSNKTFEKMLSLTNSEYVAFADQDDVWHKDKLSFSISEMLEKQKDMLCGDVDIIDEKGNLITDSITKYRKRFHFPKDNYLEHLVYKNFVLGCTIVIKRSLALIACPFLPYAMHDHYIAIASAYYNQMIILERPLIDYRIHEFNQSSSLRGVNTKEDYFEKSILKFYKRTEDLCIRFPNTPVLDVALDWAKARIGNFYHEKESKKILKKMRSLSPSVSNFELYAMNNKILFKIALKLIQNNKI